METWPATIPQRFDSGNYNYYPIDSRIISDTDAGPGKQRRRFTATPYIHEGSMLMTLAQFSTFSGFIASNIGFADDFIFPNPLDEGATTIIVRLSPYMQPPYQMTNDQAPGYVRVNISLMEVA